jgi:hypothetical protein
MPRAPHAAASGVLPFRRNHGSVRRARRDPLHEQRIGGFCGVEDFDRET